MDPEVQWESLINELLLCSCDSDAGMPTCRKNWPDDVKSWCPGCQVLESADLLQREREARMQAERELTQQRTIEHVMGLPCISACAEKEAMGQRVGYCAVCSGHIKRALIQAEDREIKALQGEEQAIRDRDEAREQLRKATGGSL